MRDIKCILLSDVNSGEEGEVIINFERGKGNIYARIVKKKM